MAFTPYFLLSPNAIMSLVGLLHGPDRTVPTPAENWREATVNVVIPAHNEEATIIQSVSSVLRQTLKPKNIILIDDGSSDRTLELAGSVCTLDSITEHAKTLCDENGVDLITIRRAAAIGKTPTIKRQSREFDADVEFILDGDTILMSDNYIERTVQELYQAIGIASACGVILPLRDTDRKTMAKDPVIQRFLASVPESPAAKPTPFFTRLARGVTNTYRNSLYMFLQKFIYRGQMVFFGSITNPVGCAVAYRRKYVKDLFDKYEPIMGDDLTNSEDIFIGMAMINQGYRNIQLEDVYAHTVEPVVQRLPRQIYMWSSAYYQCCYYFNDLMATPFKLFRNIRRKWKERKSKQEIQNKRKIQEPYRQRFGEAFTQTYGRPMGWIIFTGAVEKTVFPATLLVFILLGWWWALGITILIETVLSISVLTWVAKGQRLKFALMGLVSTPLRYSVLIWDFFTMMRFFFDIRILKTKRWSK